MIKKVKILLDPNAVIFDMSAVELTVIDDETNEILQALAFTPENFVTLLSGLTTVNALLATREDTQNV